MNLDENNNSTILRQQVVRKKHSRIPSEDGFIFVLKDNPKRGKARERFALYGEGGITVADYILAVGHRGQAMADLRWDVRKRFIEIRKLLGASGKAFTPKAGTSPFFNE